MRWALLLGLVGADAAAAPTCPSLDVQLAVADAPGAALPQIVAWLEDPAGNYVDTVFITRETGTFGLGNRPGRFDFNSAPLWPYGRRITIFPVWSTKQPLRWPEIDYQGNDESTIDTQFIFASREPHFCRPMRPEEIDGLTCASSTIFTDKGKFAETALSKYPPRADLSRATTDSESVDMYASLNPFDEISTATPQSGVLSTLSWSAPDTVPAGNYVLFVEVSKEFDMNDTYNPARFPSPDIAFGEYGLPYRGQPSVIYRVPVTLGAETSMSTDTYFGYGDPDGLDGDVRSPDATISNAPGSGAGRLALISDGGTPFRVRVQTRNEDDAIPPGAIGGLAVPSISATAASLAFIAPGDDGVEGRVARYEIRFRVGETITEDNFDTATLVDATVDPLAAGVEQTVRLTGLLPETTYSVGIRAIDNCRNASPLAVIEFDTLGRVSGGETDACFIATAAYGSVMAKDVVALRRFRDSVLAKTVLGELAIESYYTFGPPFAGVVGESDLLRATARDLLQPIVERVR